MVALAQGVRRVAAADIVMQALEGLRHQNRATMAVHDRLGQPGGTAGVNNPQGVIEIQPEGLEALGLRVIATDHLMELRLVESGREGVPDQSRTVQPDQVPDAWQRCAEFDNECPSIEVASGVGHAIAGNQHLGFYLPEAVEHCIGAHVRRADAPDRPDARRRQERDDRLRCIGQVGSDAVALLHAMVLQVQGHGSDLLAQLWPARFTRWRPAQGLLVVTENGGHACRLGRRHVPQHLLGIVDPGPDKPSGIWHRGAIAHQAGARRRAQIEIIPNALPEGVQIGG